MLALTCGVTLTLPIWPFITPYIEVQVPLNILSSTGQTAYPSVHLSTCPTFHVLRQPALIYLPSPCMCPFETTQQPPLTHTSSIRLPFTEALFVTGCGTAVLRPCPRPPGAPRLLRETGLDDCPSTWGRAQRGGDDALLGVVFLLQRLQSPLL